MGVQAKLIDLQAGAADYLSTGAIEVPMFEKEITDVVRRGSTLFQRIDTKPATSNPHNYFEQLAIATAAAVDPRNLSSTASGPNRVQRPAYIKAVTAQSNISLFDKDVTEQQGQFAYIVARDIEDILKAVEVKRSNMLWSGSDTSLSAPTTLEWMGALAQIGTQSTFNATVVPGASIIDAIKAQVAALAGQVGYDVKPSAIYLNAVLGDYIDREAKAAKIELKESIVAGVKVEALATQAGTLPLIADSYVPADTVGKYGFANPPAGNKNYYAVIVMEDMIEIPVVSGKEFSPNPRLFQLGLIGNLAGQYVAVKFDTLIVKAATYAHAIVCVQAP